MSRLQMEYFVLKPAGDDIYAQASRIAMYEYASFIKTDNPELSSDLIDWVKREGDKSRNKN